MVLQLFILSSFLAIFVSGINNGMILPSLVISLLATCLGFIHLIKSKVNIFFPKHFSLMLLFVLVLQMYLPFVENKLNHFYYSAILSQGLLYWLIFFNLKRGETFVKSFLIKLTIIYSAFYLFSVMFNINLLKLSERFFEQSSPTRHYSIGDLWAFSLMAVIGLEWTKARIWNYLYVILGLIFLSLSNIRSAYLSLSLGLFYLFYKKANIFRENKLVVIGLFFLLTLLFLYSSLGKTTIFDRMYFFQSILSFPKYPFGVGMGNFSLISDNFQQGSINYSPFSYLTLNIFLEALSGVGIFSIFFLIFLIRLFRDFIIETGVKIAWGAVVITILGNFMIDTSYSIPGLVWILFMVIGVFQSKFKSPLSS